jgi:chromosome partitioning protein
LCAVFGRNKRRQEPISAVAPELLAQGSWQLPAGVDGEIAGARRADDSSGHSPAVSRETGGREGNAVGNHDGEPADGFEGRSDALAQTGDHSSAAVRSVAATGWEPLTGTRIAHDDGSGLPVGPAEVAQSSVDGSVGGGALQWRAESATPVGGVPGGDLRTAVGKRQATRHESADGGGYDVSIGSSAAVGSLDGIDDTAAADSAPASPASLAIHSLDGADATHGAFSSAPRPQASRSVVPAAPAAVSRETTSAAETTTSVGDSDLGGHVDAPETASAQPERTGENEEVPSQSAKAGGTVHDDEARRAALVDSLPDADEDTPLMAQIQADATRRIQLRGRKFPRPAQTRIITVANQKGGVGKTTTTVNLAAALAQSGLNVLVLDNDPQGNASTALGVAHHAGTPSIYEVLVDEAPMAGAVQECPDVPNLWCVPATIDLSGAEIELVSMVARETRLRIALDAYLTGRIAAGQAPIDYVFVDCPPSLGLLTVNAFVVGREVLIPIQCEYYALEGLTQLLKTIQLIQAHLNPELHVSTILLTMYDSRTNLARQVAQEVRDHFPETTLRTSVPRSVRISEAPSYGQTVITYDSGSSGALAYLEAARELAERGAAVSGAGAEVDESASGIPLAAGDGAGTNHTNHTNGTPGDTSHVVGSSAGTHQEEQ